MILTLIHFLYYWPSSLHLFPLYMCRQVCICRWVWLFLFHGGQSVLSGATPTPCLRQGLSVVYTCWVSWPLWFWVLSRLCIPSHLRGTGTADVGYFIWLCVGSGELKCSSHICMEVPYPLIHLPRPLSIFFSIIWRGRYAESRIWTQFWLKVL